MKKIFLIIAIISLMMSYSCTNNNDKHGYLITINAPATYYVMGMKQTTNVKTSLNDLGIIKDSISVYVNDLIKKEKNEANDLLDLYYESLNKVYKDETEYITSETERATYKSFIGKTVILVIVPESFISNPSVDDLINFYKEKNPDIESHCIYDGSSILAELEINEVYKRIY